MPNPEHLAILKEGVKRWNAWREDNPKIIPDLTGADLTGANLEEVNLQGANLEGTALQRVLFTSAILRGAHLAGSNLQGADLRDADCRGADFTKANLAQANLTWTNLTWASLAEANVAGATLFETVLSYTLLTFATGLETCHHDGPSTLDYRTLAQSGRLPDLFLRGCGLSDLEIQAARLLYGDLSSKLMGGDTHGTGMPTSKGLDVTMEKIV